MSVKSEQKLVAIAIGAKDLHAARELLLEAVSAGDSLSLHQDCLILIHRCSKKDIGEDVLSLVQAINETLLSEAGIENSIGVGTAGIKESLSESIEQAKFALFAGNPNKERLYFYENMLIERACHALPKSELEKMCEPFITRGELLPPELMQTANALFDNQFNQSETARSLFIHRNTLAYRLDKIAKITGLDLRKFDDASAFRLLIAMLDRINGRNENTSE